MGRSSQEVRCGAGDRTLLEPFDYAQGKPVKVYHARPRYPTFSLKRTLENR